MTLFIILFLDKHPIYVFLLINGKNFSKHLVVKQSNKNLAVIIWYTPHNI